MPAQKIILRPENHWKSVASLTLIRSKSIVPRSRTSTNWNDASTASGPLWVPQIECAVGEWRSIYCTCLRSCWRWTFWAHTVIKMMWCDTCDFSWETITASHVIVCCHSVNHSDIHLIIIIINYYPTLQISQFSNLGTVLLRVCSGTILPIFSRSYCTTATQYDRLLPAACCPSVCL